VLLRQTKASLFTEWNVVSGFLYNGGEQNISIVAANKIKSMIAPSKRRKG
jgi:hypothetical protein